MIGIYLPYGVHRLSVQRLELFVQLILVFKEVGYRLIHQLISENDGLILISRRYVTPYPDELPTACVTLKKPWVAIAVVYVVAGLASGTVVHVKYQIKTVIPAP